MTCQKMSRTGHLCTFQERPFLPRRIDRCCKKLARCWSLVAQNEYTYFYTHTTHTTHEIFPIIKL